MLDLFGKFSLHFLEIFLQSLQFVIFLVVVLSWFPARPSRFKTFLVGIAAPVLNTARRVVPRVGMFDLSPLVAFFSIDLLRFLLLKFSQSIF